MNQQELGAHRAQLILDAIVEAAVNGQPCPSTESLTTLAGYGSSSTAHGAMVRLAERGNIRFVESGWHRIIEICALGIRTADPRTFVPEGIRSIESVVALVAEVAGLEVADLTGPCRGKLYTRPRFTACYYARQEGWSFPAIGLVVNRDHSSVMHACDQAKEMRRRDKLLARIMQRTEDALEGHPAPTFTLVPAPAVPLRDQPARPYRANLQVAPPDDSGRLDARNRRMGSIDLLAAIRREHPERCAA